MLKWKGTSFKVIGKYIAYIQGMYAEIVNVSETGAQKVADMARFENKTDGITVWCLSNGAYSNTK